MLLVLDLSFLGFMSFLSKIKGRHLSDDTAPPSIFLKKNVLRCEIQMIVNYSYHNQAILPAIAKYSVVLCPSATLMPIAQET